MNYFAFSGLFVGMTAVISGAIVMWKNPRGEKNRAFLPLCITLGGWSFFYTVWQMSTTYDQALFYIRISIAFAVCIPISNLHAILKLLDQETPLRRKIEFGFLVVTVLTLLFSPTRFFIPRVEQKLDFPFWPVPGPIMPLHFINLFGPPLWTLYLIRDKGSKASPLVRNKMKWLLVGHLIAYTGGMTNNLLWYDIPVKPYLSIFSSTAMIAITFLFFRTAAMDVNYLLRRALVYFMAFLSTALIVWGLLFSFAHMMNLPVLIGLAVLFSLVIYPFLKKFTEESVRRFAKGSEFTAKEIHTKREKMKESTYTYQDLAKNLVNLTASTFPVESAAVYFYDAARNAYTLSAQWGMKNPLVKDLLYNRSSLSIASDNPLIAFAESKGDIINMENILNENDDERLQPLVDGMNTIEAEIFAPLTFSGKARGLYVVGRKKNNRLYDEEEIETIRNFSTMGTEIMRYIISMETELNHMALYSHDMNHDIRSLLQTLQFLQSPMAETAAKDRVKNLLGNAERVASNLFESFQTSRDRSVLIMKILRGEYEKSPVDLATIVNLSAGKFSLQAEKGSIEYVVNVGSSTKPISGNQMDLTRTVDNLISNAFRYLPATNGRLEIIGKSTESAYEISIKDNGEGIEPENLEAIWKLGWQGKDAKRGAAGLGLAIVKQIVQIHNGTIQAFSDGKGSGTEFRVALPFAEGTDKPAATI